MVVEGSLLLSRRHMLQLEGEVMMVEALFPPSPLVAVLGSMSVPTPAILGGGGEVAEDPPHLTSSAAMLGGVSADPPDGGGGESAPITAAHATLEGEVMMVEALFPPSHLVLVAVLGSMSVPTPAILGGGGEVDGCGVDSAPLAAVCATLEGEVMMVEAEEIPSEIEDDTSMTGSSMVVSEILLLLLFSRLHGILTFQFLCLSPKSTVLSIKVGDYVDYYEPNSIRC
jgi:hypothetical protein